MKKFKVRHEGVVSQARRPIENEEYLSVLSILRAQPWDDLKKYRTGSILTLQWHLIARIDDMMKFKFENLMPNVRNPSALIAKMRWSKNISEERDAPEQIVLGRMDPRICQLLNLAAFLEVAGESWCSMTPLLSK